MFCTIITQKLRSLNEDQSVECIQSPDRVIDVTVHCPRSFTYLQAKPTDLAKRARGGCLLGASIRRTVIRLKILL